MLMKRFWTACGLAVVLSLAGGPVAKADSQKTSKSCTKTVDITLSLDATNKKVTVSDSAAHVGSTCGVEWVTSLPGASWCTWFFDDANSAFPPHHKTHCKTKPDNVRSCPGTTTPCPYTYVGLVLYNGQVYVIDPQIIVDPGGGEPGGKKKGKKK